MLKKPIFSFVIIVIFIALFCFILSVDTRKDDKKILFNHTIKIGNQMMTASFADSDKKREQGLSGTDHLDYGNSMLFIFNNPNIPNFWMKDMNYSLDIIWIDQNKKVIGFVENVDPASYPKTFAPDGPVLYTLEVPAFFTKKSGIKIGDVLEF